MGRDQTRHIGVWSSLGRGNGLVAHSAIMDTSGVDDLTKKIEKQKETIKELTEELEGFAKGLEAVATDGFTKLEMVGDRIYRVIKKLQLAKFMRVMRL